MAAHLAAPTPNFAEVAKLSQQRNTLLINAGGPQPIKLLNQRQRRKLARQTNNFPKRKKK